MDIFVTTYQNHSKGTFKVEVFDRVDDAERKALLHLCYDFEKEESQKQKRHIICSLFEYHSHRQYKNENGELCDISLTKHFVKTRT